MLLRNKHFRYFSPDDPGEVTPKPNEEELKQQDPNTEVKPVTPDLEQLDKEIENLELKLSGESTPDAPPTPDKEISDNLDSITGNQPKENQPPDNTQKPEDQPPANTPVNEADKDNKDKANLDMVITEDILKGWNLAPDEERQARKFLNKPLHELVKSYANAQKAIGKKKEDLLKTLGEGEIPTQTNTQTPIIPAPAKTQTPDEVAQAKDEYVYNALLKDFPELPKDPDERKAWLSTLNYEDREKADEYIEKKRTLTREIETVWAETERLRTNQPAIIDKQINEALADINTFIVDEARIKPEELGYDLKLDEKGENQLINELLADPKNPDDFDPKVIVKFNGVQLINKDALVNKFIALNRRNIISKIEARARAEGAQSVKQPTPVAPSMGTTMPGKGAVSKEITANKVYSDTAEIDNLLDQIETKFSI